MLQEIYRARDDGPTRPGGTSGNKFSRNRMASSEKAIEMFGPGLSTDDRPATRKRQSTPAKMSFGRWLRRKFSQATAYCSEAMRDSQWQRSSSIRDGSRSRYRRRDA